MTGITTIFGRRFLSLAGLWLMVACGCTEQLETGYKPHPLNASPAQRRAFYASPFSPEAEEGAKESPQNNNFHKPGAL